MEGTMQRILRTSLSLAVGCAAVLIANASQAQSVAVGSVSGSPGDSVQVPVTLTTNGVNVTALSVDIGFPPTTPFAPKPPPPTGRALCTLDPRVTNKPQSAFPFLPASCTLGTTCNTLRANIVALDPNDPDLSNQPIGDGVVYSCTFPIPGTATPGSAIDLTVVKAVATVRSGEPPANMDVTITEASTGGKVNVSTGPTATTTPTATATASHTPVPPTATNTVPVTATPTRTNTPTVTQTPTVTNTRAPSMGEDDGCEVVSPAQGQAGWLLLIPAAILIWRRRSR